MPTARQDSGAVHIPGLGVLVVGGSVEKEFDSPPNERDAEILKFDNLSSEDEMTWIKISPLLKSRSMVSAVYFDGSVYVSSAEDETIEMLSLPSGQPGQWTLLSSCDTEDRIPYCLGVFKGKMFATGKLLFTFLSLSFGIF